MPLEGDEIAIELARGFVTATACEIWQDDRIVEVMLPRSGLDRQRPQPSTN
jgi:hypothetical protein